MQVDLKAKPFPNSRNISITFRLYDPSLSPQLIDLEANAKQGFTLFGLIDFGKIFSAPYDSKSKKYPDSIILVAEHNLSLSSPTDGSKATSRLDRIQNLDSSVTYLSNSNIKICAGVSLAIKNIYFNSQPVKAGYIYDLRVHSDYQRIGLGYHLSLYLEKLAIEKGCQFLLLAVSGRNSKAIGLYHKLQFQEVSIRRIYSLPVPYYSITPEDSSRIVKLDPNNEIKLFFRRARNSEAKDLLEKFYKNQDFALVDMDEILASHCFEGLYIVENESGHDVGGVCLAKTENDNFMGLSRIFFPTVYYTKNWFKAFWVAGFGTLFVLAESSIKTRLIDASLDESSATAVALLSFLVIMFLFTWAFFKGLSWLEVAAGHAGRGRLFAPFYMGEKKFKKKIMEYLYEKMMKIARLKDLNLLRVNFGETDEMANFYPSVPKIKFRQLFMGKPLQGSSLESNREKSSGRPTEGRNTFFDPRDL